MLLFHKLNSTKKIQNPDKILRKKTIQGPSAGEGCSTAGGCASCPFMKVRRCPISRARPFFSSFCFNFRMVLIVHNCCDFLYCTLCHMFLYVNLRLFFPAKIIKKNGPKIAFHAQRDTYEGPPPTTDECLQRWTTV